MLGGQKGRRFRFKCSNTSQAAPKSSHQRANIRHTHKELIERVIASRRPEEHDLIDPSAYRIPSARSPCLFELCRPAKLAILFRP